METHFRGPKGEYRCVIHNTDAMPNGWLVERLNGLKRHVINMHMTRKDAFKHALELSGLHDSPDIAMRAEDDVRVVELPADRRGLVAHTKAQS